MCHRYVIQQPQHYSSGGGLLLKDVRFPTSHSPQEQPCKTQHIPAGAPFAPRGDASFPCCLQQQPGSVPTAHAGARARQGSQALLVPTKHTAREKGMRPSRIGRDSPPLQAFLGHRGGSHTSPDVCLLCLSLPVLTPD